MFHKCQHYSFNTYVAYAFMQKNTGQVTWGLCLSVSLQHIQLVQKSSLPSSNRQQLLALLPGPQQWCLSSFLSMKTSTDKMKLSYSRIPSTKFYPDFLLEHKIKQASCKTFLQNAGLVSCLKGTWPAPLKGKQAQIVPNQCWHSPHSFLCLAFDLLSTLALHAYF